MAQDYKALDSAILEAVRAGHRQAKDIIAQCEGLAAPHCLSWRGVCPPPAWRVVDRRLQALRKADKLTFQRPGGWTLDQRNRKAGNGAPAAACHWPGCPHGAECIHAKP